ncbi:MAG: YegP family protein [Thermomicrobiales bacterium]
MTYWIYIDRNREWRWQLVATNGRIIADSGEGYVHRNDCLTAIELVKNSKAAPVKER